MTYSISDNCTNDSASATFTVTPNAPVDVTGPSDVLSSSCDYNTQIDVNNAFNAWVAQFTTVNSGCNGTAQFNISEFQAPDLCKGGSVSLTYSISDNCTNDSASATFTVTPAAPIVVNNPSDSTTNASDYSTQSDADNAFNLWLLQFSVSGGCSPSGTFNITPKSPYYCGGSISLTFTVTDKCYQSTSVTKTFTITPPAQVNVGSPSDSTTSACNYPDQTAADSAFTAWLSQFTVSGGINPTGSFGNQTPTAPAYCGGTVSVTYTVSDRCYDSTSVTKTFTITLPSNVIVNTPNDSITSTCSYSNQNDADAAFNSWLSSFNVIGGCAPSTNLTDSNSTVNALPTAPSYCGGSTSVTYTVMDKCYQTTSVTKVFTITPANQLIVSTPNDSSTNSCDYASQSDLENAFTTWLNGFNVSGGCAPKGNFGTTQPIAPNLCQGGTTTVTFYVEDKCSSKSITKNFTVNPNTPVDVTGPSNVSASSCDYADQNALNTAFNSWVAQFQTVNSGCGGNAQFNISEYQVPNLCQGGSVSLTYSISDKCSQDSVSSTFTVIPSSPVIVNNPADSSTTACSYTCQTDANTAFNNWLAQFTVSGGCSPKGIFNTTPVAPAYCGGSTSVTYTVTDKCYQSTSVTKTFTITAPSAVVVNAPTNSSTSVCNYTSQTAINTAFNSWLAGFSVSGGCSPKGIFSGTPTAPTLCQGGTTTVTYTVKDKCYSTTTVTRTFTLTPASAITLNCASDVTVPACSSQSQINTAWASFLASTTASGGCGNGTLTNNAPSTPPSTCGGYVDVTWTYKSNNPCGQTTYTCNGQTTQGTSVSCTKRFTVSAPPAVTINCATDVTVPSCSTQNQINSAWTAFLASTTVSGGCGSGTLTNNAPSTPPSTCGGYVDVTWTYTSTLNCSQPSGSCQGQTSQSNVYKCTKRFTVAAPSAIKLNCGSDVTVPSCSTQAQINTAWNAFLASTTVSGGCGSGTLTNNAPSTPPSTCGGYVDVTWTYTSTLNCSQPSGSCQGQTSQSNVYKCTKRFTVASAPAVTFNCGADKTVTACSTQAQINAAWNSFLASTTYSGGCSNGTLTNNAPSTPPSACGGYVDVTWTYNSNSSCGQTTYSCNGQTSQGNSISCTKRFTVASPAPVVFKCGSNVTVAACSTQAQINAAWSSFLASTTACGGCGGVLTNNAPSTPPSITGGFVYVTWTYTLSNACGQSDTNTYTCTKRFTVPSSTPVTFTCGSDVIVPACSSQAQINVAWATFLASTTASGGCGNGTLTNNAPSTPPSSCGGYVDVTWTYTSGTSGQTYSCNGQTSQGNSISCTKRFRVAAASAVTFNCGSDVTIPACSSQSQINAAWASFLASTTVSGGCSGNLTNNAPSTPPSSCGGYVDVTWTYTASNGCGQTTYTCNGQTSQGSSISCTKRFRVASSTPVTFNCGSDVTVPACSSQSQINAAWASFLASTTVSGGCSGNLTNNAPSTPPSSCGGYVDVTWTYTASGSCGQSTYRCTGGGDNGNNGSTYKCTKRFTVASSTPVTFNCGSNVTIPACSTQAQINSAWASFLASTTISGGGCSNGTLTNNAPANPPSACAGGYVDVTWTYSAGNSSCGQTTYTCNGQTSQGSSISCTKRFTVQGGGLVDVTGPSSVNYSGCNFNNQCDLNNAFNCWLAQFKTVSSGCGATTSCGGSSSGGATAVFSGDNRVAPNLYCGGTIRVTYTITGSCNQDTVTATFKVSARTNSCNHSCSKPTTADNEDLSIKVYPNPFTENFNLSVTNAIETDFTISIYDMIGKLVEERTIKATEINDSPIGDRIPSGVYNVVISNGEIVKTMRVIKR